MASGTYWTIRTAAATALAVSAGCATGLDGGTGGAGDGATPRAGRLPRVEGPLRRGRPGGETGRTSRSDAQAW
ncbi:hypothetical protein [Streptosporangium vulgare]|uniref:hypothetical protein n=1 Tax=Streptosporangium vulgare TaxID=46190 RepID=UPI0031D17A16